MFDLEVKNPRKDPSHVLRMCGYMYFQKLEDDSPNEPSAQVPRWTQLFEAKGLLKRKLPVSRSFTPSFLEGKKEDPLKLEALSSFRKRLKLQNLRLSIVVATSRCLLLGKFFFFFFFLIFGFSGWVSGASTGKKKNFCFFFFGEEIL